MSPLLLAATLREIWKEGRSRSVMLRMLPPERRPVLHQPHSMGASPTDHKRPGRPLWTLRDCQIELLTEGVIHAFEAGASAYRPDRVASTCPPGRILLRRNARRGDHASILLRTRERSAETPVANGGAKDLCRPKIDTVLPDTMTNLGLVRPVQNPGVA